MGRMPPDTNVRRSLGGLTTVHLFSCKKLSLVPTILERQQRSIPKSRMYSNQCDLSAGKVYRQVLLRSTVNGRAQYCRDSQTAHPRIQCNHIPSIGVSTLTLNKATARDRQRRNSARMSAFRDRCTRGSNFFFLFLEEHAHFFFGRGLDKT